MKKLDIKRALREHHMTQVELCKRTGLLTQNMSPIINGNPTISKLTQIAEGIGCDITDLFYPDPADEAAEKARAEQKEVEESVTKFKKGRVRANGPLGRTLGEYLRAIDLDKITEDYYAQIGAIKEKIYEAFPAVEWSGEGKNIEKLMKDLEAEKENKQEDAPQEGTQQENIQPESAKTTIQTSTFCPHCGKKVRVGVVLLPEE